MAIQRTIACGVGSLRAKNDLSAASRLGPFLGAAVIFLVVGTLVGCGDAGGEAGLEDDGEYAGVAYLKFSTDGPLIPAMADSRQVSLSDRIRTHIALIRSPLVLNATLARPGIAEIPEIKRAGLMDAESGEVDWLREHLEVENLKGTAIVLIRMKGEDEEETQKIVSAVAHSYLDKVVAHERNQLLGRVEGLSRQLRRKEEDIRQRRAAYQELVDAVDAVDGSTAASQRQFLEEEKKVRQREVSRVGGLILRQKLEIQFREVEWSGDAEDFKDEVIQNQLVQNAQYIGFLAQIQRLQDREKELAANVKGGVSKPLEDIGQQIKDTQKQVDELRSQLIDGFSDEEFEHPIVMQIRKLKMRLAATEHHLTGVIGELEEVQRNIQRLTVHAPELQQREDELQRMETVSREVGLQLERLQLRLNISDSRVILVSEGK